MGVIGKQTGLKFFLVLLILILPFISSAMIENQTIIQSSISNSTIRFEQDTTLDQLTVTNQLLEIYNISTDAKFTNINQSYNAQLNFYGLINALVYNGNGTIFGSADANSNDGNVNMIFSPNNLSFVLNNFNLTQGETRLNSPLWFSYSSGNIRNASSNLTDAINLTIAVNTSGIIPSSPRFISSTGTFAKTYNSSEFSYNSGSGLLILNASGLESGSNQILIDTEVPSVTFSCSSASVEINNAINCTCSSSSSDIQTISYTENPDTNTTGTFTTSCVVTDYAGNQGTSDLSYTVSSPPATATTTSESGGGSTSLTNSQTIVIPSATTEQEVNFSNFKEESVITKIIFNVKNTTTNAILRILEYSTAPPGNTTNYPENVYRYVRVNTNNVNENLEKATVTFRVEKSWVSEKNLDKGNPSLFRFDETSNKWEELSTTYNYEDDSFYYYASELDHFSLFAISEGTKTIVQEIVEEITRSYSEASRTFLGLLIWWTLVFILLTAMALTLVIIIPPITAEIREHFPEMNYIKVKHQLRK